MVASAAVDGAVVPDVSAFVRALSPDGSGARAVRLLRERCVALDPKRALPERVETLERLGRWVCDGPKPPTGAEATEPAATTRLRLLVRALGLWPVFRERLASLVASVLRESDALRLLCEVGLPNDRGLFDETSDRLARRLLPTPPDYADLAELVARLFRTERDATWLASLPAALVTELQAQMGDVWQPLRDAALDALALLTTRVSALGLSEDVRRRGPSVPVRESPFFHLPHAPGAELAELTHACRRDIEVVRLNLDRFGVSVDVVYRLDVIIKCLDRIDALLLVLDPRVTPELVSAETTFVAELCRSRVRERSIRDVVRENMQMLARKVIERAGETGEHYITVTRGEWWKMLGAAGGGGLLTVGTAVAKFAVKLSHLAPAFEGLLYSLNYALSFVGIQVLGFALATKQPSMTAAALAGSIRDRPGAHQLDDLVTTIARICRSQLAAVLGNVVVVIPGAVAFDWYYRAKHGQPYLDAETARHTVESFHPFHSWTIGFAALTGVLLWASSLGAGWLENWAVYRRLPEAIAEHRIKRYVGSWLPRFCSRFFKKHVAGFGGSVSLGFLLGMVPAFGTFFGLHLDVRHVTLSTGALTLGVASLGPSQLLEPPVLWAWGGVVCMGVMNLSVSFGLALAVAFRARAVPLSRMFALTLAVIARFVSSPLEFLYAPASETGEVFSHRPSLGSRVSLPPPAH